jgi:hypothetical protein
VCREKEKTETKKKVKYKEKEIQTDKEEEKYKLINQRNVQSIETLKSSNLKSKTEFLK